MTGKSGGKMKNKLAPVIKILAEGIVTLLFVTFLSFLLMRLAPIDQAEAYARRNTVQPSQERIEEIRADMGLDKPLFRQYIVWLGNAVCLDFGNSLTNNKPVRDDLVFAAGISLRVIVLSVLVQIPLSILIACGEYFLSKRRGRLVLEFITILLISVPTFYIASIYLDLFAVKYSLIKVVNASGFLRCFSPAICIALPASAFYGRLLGSNLVKEQNKDYVFFLRCRGLPEHLILLRHVLPHGLFFVLPSFMQNIGMLMASAGVIEKMFNVPGIGYMLIDHVLARDAPMIHAILLFFALVFVVTNVAGKILQLSLDQQGRYAA